MRTKRYGIELFVGLFCALVINGLSPVGAASANISHSYQATTPVPAGSLVSLSVVKTGYIELANTDNSSRLLGVAVQSNDSLLAVDASQGSVQVATDGTATALVSNVNGSINVGDLVAVSPFDGVGMKDVPGSRVIGLAQTAFNGNNGVSETVRDKSGKSSTIKIGYVQVSIGITTVSTDNANAQPKNILQKYALSLTGHSVPTWRIAVSAIVTAVAFIALVTLIYASIYGSIVSVGRNPLAKYAIFRTLRSVLGMAIVTAGLASLTVYLLMR
jgi:hypothetical protein